MPLRTVIITTRRAGAIASVVINRGPGNSGVGASVTISATPPANPRNGDQWYDSETGTLAVWDGTVWVGQSNPAVAAAIAEFLAAENAAGARTALGLKSAATKDGASLFHSVKDYGALGDGTTNDTTAIHSAVTAAKADNGVVFFPPGTYRCNLSVTGNVQLVGSGNGDVGDWTGAGTGRTTLIPDSNASPIVRATNVDGFRMEKMELRGNGAGTTTSGLKIEAPGGYLLQDVTIRRCTNNLHSLAGCNVTVIHSAFLQGTRNVYCEDTGFAHSYLFLLCSLGGAPVAGDGRCFEVLGNSFLTIVQCEQGNCTDWLLGASGQNINVIGSNWESFSASVLATIGTSTLNFMGGRMAVDGKTIVRSSAAARVSVAGMEFGASNIMLAHTGDAELYAKSGTSSNVTVEEWTAGFAALTGSAPARPIRVSARLTTTQTVGSGATAVLFNSVAVNTGSKYTAGTGVFKPGKRGYYQVSASLRLSAVAGGYAGIRFLVNNVERSNPALITSGGAGTTICGADVVYLDADDELKVCVTSGGTIDVQPGSNYSTTLSIVEWEQ